MTLNTLDRSAAGVIDLDMKKIYNKSIDEEISTAFNDLSKCEGEELSKKCGVVFLRGSGKKSYKRYVVNVLNKTYSVELETREVMDLISGKPASKELALVILRYLAYSSGGRGSETWIPYENLPDSRKYLELFRRNVTRPFIKTFGSNPEKYELVCRRMGGKKEKLGGISYSFYFLPKVQLLTQLWKIREEFSQPAANISFNSSVKFYLNARDLLLVAKTMVESLENEAKKI